MRICESALIDEGLSLNLNHASGLWLFEVDEEIAFFFAGIPPWIYIQLWCQVFVLPPEVDVNFGVVYHSLYRWSQSKQHSSPCSSLKRAMLYKLYSDSHRHTSRCRLVSHTVPHLYSGAASLPASKLYLRFQSITPRIDLTLPTCDNFQHKRRFQEPPRSRYTS